MLVESVNIKILCRAEPSGSARRPCGKGGAGAAGGSLGLRAREGSSLHWLLQDSVGWRVLREPQKGSIGDARVMGHMLSGPLWARRHPRSPTATARLGEALTPDSHLRAGVGLLWHGRVTGAWEGRPHPSYSAPWTGPGACAQRHTLPAARVSVCFLARRRSKLWGPWGWVWGRWAPSPRPPACSWPCWPPPSSAIPLEPSPDPIPLCESLLPRPTLDQP